MQKVVISVIVYFVLSQSLLHRFVCLFVTLNLWECYVFIFYCMYITVLFFLTNFCEGHRVEVVT